MPLEVSTFDSLILLRPTLSTFGLRRHLGVCWFVVAHLSNDVLKVGGPKIIDYQRFLMGQPNSNLWNPVMSFEFWILPVDQSFALNFAHSIPAIAHRAW